MGINLFELITQGKLMADKSTIGFGLINPDKEIIKSLISPQKYANIILIGSYLICNIPKFNIVATQNPEKKLTEMMVNEEVEGIVRGILDDFKTFESYKKIVGYNETDNMTEIVLVEDYYGRQFFSEISNSLWLAAWINRRKQK